MSSGHDSAALPLNASLEKPPSELAPEARLPFRGFKHWGGPLAGLSAGALAVLVAWIDPKTPFLAVGLCVLGALNAYLLSLINKSLIGSIVAVLGGFAVGLVGVGLPTFLADLDAGADDLAQRVMVPVLLFFAPILVGTGPLLLAMLFQIDRPRGFLVRLLLGTAAGLLAAICGLVVYGMLDSLFDALPDGLISVAAFTAANYVLFRLQVLCLIESAGGDNVLRPGYVDPADDTPASAPPPSASAAQADDEP